MTDTPYRAVVRRNTREWREMWQALAAYEVARGEIALSPDWKYLSTERGDNGLWFHIFRHVNHPRTHRTMVVKIAATGEWEEAQEQKQAKEQQTT
jgi:hypothetical protein